MAPHPGRERRLSLPSSMTRWRLLIRRMLSYRIRIYLLAIRGSRELRRVVVITMFILGPMASAFRANQPVGAILPFQTKSLWNRLILRVHPAFARLVLGYLLRVPSAKRVLRWHLLVRSRPLRFPLWNRQVRVYVSLWRLDATRPRSVACATIRAGMLLARRFYVRSLFHTPVLTSGRSLRGHDLGAGRTLTLAGN